MRPHDYYRRHPYPSRHRWDRATMIFTVIVVLGATITGVAYLWSELVLTGVIP